MIEIRPYRDSDFGEFASLMREWGDDYAFDEETLRASIGRVLSDGKSRVAIARRDGLMEGYAQYGECHLLGFEPFVETAQLLVAAGARSKGIGRALMNYIEEEAVRMGIGEVRLSSQVHRSRAHVFYERLGYECCKISKFYRKTL